MDPITTAIAAALLAGATESVTEVAKNAIVDAYNGLKSLIQKKFGPDSDVVKAAETMEVAPDSEKLKTKLHDEIVASKADQDPEVLKAAQDLIEKVNAHPDGASYIQQATGNYIAQAQHGSTATVNIGPPSTAENTANKPTAS